MLQIRKDSERDEYKPLGKTSDDYTSVDFKGKTKEQIKVFCYFYFKDDKHSGCLGMGKNKLFVDDSEFDSLVDNFLDRNNSEQEALDKIGVDKSQVQEIDPINFCGFTFDANYKKLNNSSLFKSSSVQTSWLFFSKDQVYVFQKTMKLDESSTNVKTEEYFYKDIVNFSTRTEERELEGRNYIDNTFSVIVPGDSFICTLPQNMDTAERSIQGMKAKLREKKNA